MPPLAYANKLMKNPSPLAMSSESSCGQDRMKLTVPPLIDVTFNVPGKAPVPAWTYAAALAAEKSPCAMKMSRSSFESPFPLTHEPANCPAGVTPASVIDPAPKAHDAESAVVGVLASLVLAVTTPLWST